MKFEEALKLMREGKKVRVPRWRKGVYIFIDNNQFKLNSWKGIIIYDFELSLENLLSTDWEEVK